MLDLKETTLAGLAAKNARKFKKGSAAFSIILQEDAEALWARLLGLHSAIKTFEQGEVSIGRDKHTDNLDKYGHYSTVLETAEIVTRGTDRAAELQVGYSISHTYKYADGSEEEVEIFLAGHHVFASYSSDLDVARYDMPFPVSYRSGNPFILPEIPAMAAPLSA